VTNTVSRSWTRAMTSMELRTMFLDYFKQLDHAIIPSASLIPDGDASVLFTTAGMHPLVPYLMGRDHPAGDKLTSCQKCIRTNDLVEVGDLTHLTLFEMLGNWSLGSYFKNESIEWSYRFLTEKNYLAIPPELLWVTCFSGNEVAAKDTDAAGIWNSLGIPNERIVFLDETHNWWATGPTGPCGPDTEIFVDMTEQACDLGEQCLPGLCDCGRFFEIWNNVFMTFNRDASGLNKLPKQNVDTGMGFERVLAAINGVESVYEIDTFRTLIDKLIGMTPFSREEVYSDEKKLFAIRVVSDHLRTSSFILGDEQPTSPSNQGQGYVLRQLIRRAIRYCGHIQLDPKDWASACHTVTDLFGESYPELRANRETISNELNMEADRFKATLSKGEKLLSAELEKVQSSGASMLPGDIAFKLYDTYGFPLEFTQEIADEKGIGVDTDGFDRSFEIHKKLSASNAAKSGLADDSWESTQYHTATHLLHAALRQILGTHVLQRGSNITSERMRFDFSHSGAMTKEEIAQVSDLVQGWIESDIGIEQLTLEADKAREMGAIGLFTEKYEDIVSVYKIGDFSLEFCGGPHVSSTGELGTFKIAKEQSSSSGVRRIRATLS